MKYRFVFALVCAATLSVTAFGHGNLQHVIGTVKAISPNSITVETAGSQPKEVTVVVLSATTFQKSGENSSLKELKVGDRVVIHAKPDGAALDAVTVAFGKTAVRSSSSPGTTGNEQH